MIGNHIGSPIGAKLRRDLGLSLFAESGVYTYTGQAVADPGTVAAGAYTLNGQVVVLARSYQMVAGPGAYTYAGAAVGSVAADPLAVAAYAYVGNSVEYAVGVAPFWMSQGAAAGAWASAGAVAVEWTMEGGVMNDWTPEAEITLQ